MTARTLQPKTVREFPEYLDFERLRSEGIRHIQGLAGEIWTDHNSHDPGITLLEVLCYALTDLGYRTNLDIHDLFAPDPNVVVAEDDNFSTAARILSCNPLTILDYRKLLIDLDGIKNAWFVVADGVSIARAETGLNIDVPKSQLLFEHKNATRNNLSLNLNGLYKVLLELDDVYLKQEAAKGRDATGNILVNVHEILHAHRNLCEDFLSIQVLRDERISLCTDIELAANATPETVMLAIFEKVQAFLSPDIPFYTLKGLLEKGATPDQAFEGRPLRLDGSHGFIDAEELAQMERRKEIHVSDIYRLILNTEGVVAVKKLSLLNLTNSTSKVGEEWILPLTPDAFRPVLDALASTRSMNFTKRGVTYSVDSPQVLQVFEKKLANRLKVLKQGYDLDLPIPLGNHRSDLGEHYSIQNDLPSAYGTSKTAFPTRNSSPEERVRQSQALQLKGYMLFFDRLLSNYLAQLAQVRQQFSPHLDPDNEAVAAIGNLSDVPFLDKLLPFDNNVAAILRGVAFEKGETIAKVIDPKTKRRRVFATPQARDSALQQIMADFDADTVLESFPKAEATGLYHFQVESQKGRQVVLRSRKIYNTENEARAALGAVRFLATLESSYERRLQRPGTSHHYTFDWTYQIPDFKQFMRQTTESRQQYFERKNKLFDHLLGRFSEDFTDYTLLMFGMYKNSIKQPTVADFATDKANFIQKYPDISRNRAKGFNQKALPSEYWKGLNISGVENRLATMLGFNKRGNKQLNFFEITSDDRANVILRDRRGIPILHAMHPLHPSEITDFETLLNQSASLPKAFEPYENKSEKLFGFRLLDKEGCVIAFHPYTYATEAVRDNAMHYVRLVTRDDDRLPVEFVAKTKGFYANIQTADGRAAFRATQAAATEQDAQLVALHIKRAAEKRNNYEIFNVPSQGFTFGLRLNTKEFPNEPYVAVHPSFYTSEADCEKTLDKIHLFFSTNPLKISVSQLPARHRWAVATPEGDVLECLHFFKTLPQTRAAARLALQLALKSDNFEAKHNTDGTVTMRLVKKDKYPSELPNGRIEYKTLKTPIASTKPFASMKEAEAGVDKIILLAEAILKKITKNEDSNIVGALKLETAAGLFKAVLQLPDGSVGLADLSRYLTADTAEINFYNDLKAACDGFWCNESVNNDCAKGFSLTNKADLKVIIAEHPTLYTNIRERDDVQAQIQNWVCENRALINIELVNEAWQFQLVCLDSQGNLAVILRGPDEQNHVDEAAAQTFFNTKVRKPLTAFNDNQIEKTTEDNAFGFYYQDNKVRLAEHPLRYAAEGDCDRVIKKLVKCLQPLVNGGFIVEKDVCECEDIDGKNRNTDRRRWRVRDEQARVAIYQKPFDCKKAEEERLKLVQKYRCHPPPYSNFVAGDGAIMNDGFGTWQWMICTGKQVMWQSADGFDSKEKAREDFEAMLMPVMTAALELNNYRVRPNFDPEDEEFEDSEKAKKVTERFYILDLLDAHGKVIADSGKHFCSVASVHEGIALRHNYAQLFPLVQVEKGINFQIFNGETRTIDWLSAKHFTTWQAALDAFDNFIDMLGFEAHYHILGDDECDCQIALTEVLLEDAESFFTRIAATQTELGTTDIDADKYSWQQVENFLDAYQTVDPSMAISIYADEADGPNRYRWQLVSDDYELARHPKAFHTSFESVLQRDVLYNLSQNEGAVEKVKKVSQQLNTLSEALKFSMRQIDNYFVEKRTKGSLPTVYLIGVKTSTTDKTVFDYEYDSEDALLSDLDDTYTIVQEAFQVPRSGGRFGFEIKVVINRNAVNVLGSTIPFNFAEYKTLWESAKTYTKENTVNLIDDYNKCIRLQKTKANYQVVEIPTNPPSTRFTVQIHSQIEAIAIHPIGFSSAATAATQFDTLFTQSKTFQEDQRGKKILYVYDKLPISTQNSLGGLENYFIVVENGGLMLIGVRDETTGQPTVFDYEYKSLSELLEDLDQVYSNFQRDYIVPRVEGGYGFVIRLLVGTHLFQLPGLATAHPFSKYETIWESVKAYPIEKAIDLETAYRRCLELIKDKSSYIQTHAADGSFLLTIRNSAQVLAKASRRYLSQTSARKAAERALTYVDTEGFHLLEHLLLRPRYWRANTVKTVNDPNSVDSQRFLLPIQVQAADINTNNTQLEADADFKNYIIGGDPYSMTATIVLPYWSRRFRNVDFREFFENTLRRETPAHIWLDIYWITPEQMQAFEKQLRGWLNKVNDPKTSAFAANTACLIDVLRVLKNTFPLAVLSDCGSGIPPVILDSTTIG